MPVEAQHLRSAALTEELEQHVALGAGGVWISPVFQGRSSLLDPRGDTSGAPTDLPSRHFAYWL